MEPELEAALEKLGSHLGGRAAAIAALTKYPDFVGTYMNKRIEYGKQIAMKHNQPTFATHELGVIESQLRAGKTLPDAHAFVLANRARITADARKLGLAPEATPKLTLLKNTTSGSENDLLPHEVPVFESQVRACGDRRKALQRVLTNREQIARHARALGLLND